MTFRCLVLVVINFFFGWKQYHKIYKNLILFSFKKIRPNKAKYQCRNRQRLSSDPMSIDLNVAQNWEYGLELCIRGPHFWRNVQNIYFFWLHEKPLHVKCWAILTICESTLLYLKFAKIVIFHKNAHFPAFIFIRLAVIMDFTAL